MSGSGSEAEPSFRDILMKSVRKPTDTHGSPKDKSAVPSSNDDRSSHIPAAVPAPLTSSSRAYHIAPMLQFPTVNVPGTMKREDNIWDPSDEEWAEVDARRVVQTFTASYQAPGVKSSALSYLVSSVTSAFRDSDELDGLANTYYYDPSGDLHDEVMQEFWTNESRYFLLGTAVSPRHMHVIDLRAYFNANSRALPRLCDAVATILSHTNKQCLEAFLDPTIKECTYRREVDSSKGGLILVIRRNGNEVICGAYVNFGFMLQWKLYIKSVVDITGQWHEVHATTKPGMMNINNGVPFWNAINADKPEDKEIKGAECSQQTLQLSPTKKKIDTAEGVDERKPGLMLYQSRFLARHLLWDIWYRFDNLYQCRATLEADGEESQVWLKRELVGCACDKI